MSETKPQKTPDTIWEGDLFDRRKEAEALIAYIESLSDRNQNREDAHSFTIAIDTPYGTGKTYFLKRLAQHLSLNHPVAYVDAWADDIADEPLTALAATLKRALDPFIGKDADITYKLQNVMEKTGQIAKIVGLGLLKKGISLVIGGVAVDGAHDVLKDFGEDTKSAINDSLKSSGTDAIEIGKKSYETISPSQLMNEKIESFEAGQNAIQGMKDSLLALVQSLEGKDQHPPIVIIIDELDRCRPTYAVKLLEEIKHLFDVPGLVFVFGMNGEQLGHSLTGAYGSKFDGADYLRRFIQRRYRLAEPSLEPLLALLLKESGIDLARLRFPDAQIDIYNARFAQLPTSELIARYMKAYGKTARDAYQIIDMLQTCAAIIRPAPILMAYLVPLLIGKINGDEVLKEPKNIDQAWMFFLSHNHPNKLTTVNYWQLTQRLHSLSNMTVQERNDYMNTSDDYSQFVILNDQTCRGNKLAQISGYKTLIETVGRFTTDSDLENKELP